MSSTLTHAAVFVLPVSAAAAAVMAAFRAFTVKPLVAVVADRPWSGIGYTRTTTSVPQSRGSSG